MKNIALIIDNRPVDPKVIMDHMRHLPKWELKHLNHYHIETGEDYNKILVDFEFWKQYRNYDNVLIFQHDSMILRDGIEEFLEYDFIGAPIEHIAFPAMNGGLSLRKPKAMMECIRLRPRNRSIYRNHNEDMYFSFILSELGYNLPTKEVAQKFSVETIFGLGSFGYHQPETWLTPEQCKEIKNQYNV